MFTQMNGGIMRMAKLDYKYGAGEYLKSREIKRPKLCIPCSFVYVYLVKQKV